MKTIGIDPGLAGTGVGIIRGTGLKVDGFSYCSISTSKKDNLPDRLVRIYTNLKGILIKEQPDCMIIEDVFSLPKYPKSSIMLGKVVGVILLAGAQCGIRTVEVSVREAKQILTGNGNASKQQFERSVRHLLNLDNPIRPYHASDAVGLALIGLFRYQGAQQQPSSVSGGNH
jgi:crossover junction endodeoxyribonuclease RuvC